MTWRWRSFFVHFSSLPNSTLFWRQWRNNQQSDDANKNEAPCCSAAPGIRYPAANESSQERIGASQEELSSAWTDETRWEEHVDAAAPRWACELSQSVALEPVGSCEDTLTLLSEPLQPLYSNNDWWAVVHVFCMSVCVLLHRSVTTY